LANAAYTALVGGIGLNEQVNVLSRTRLCVERHGITSDDQVLNFLVVEDGQEFFEVVEHPVWIPSSGKPQG